MSIHKNKTCRYQSVSSVAPSCPTLCDSMNCSTPGLPVHHHLPEFTQTHVHRVRDAIQPSHPGSSASPPATNHSQHQSLFQWVNSSHEVSKVLELQLYHHPFQRNPRVDLLQNVNLTKYIQVLHEKKYKTNEWNQEQLNKWKEFVCSWRAEVPGEATQYGKRRIKSEDWHYPT